MIFMDHVIKVDYVVKVTEQDIDDIVATALEGGINYWCCKAEVVGDYLGEYASEQISRGGELKLYDAEGDDVYTLTQEKLLKGIKLAIENMYYHEYDWYAANELDCCQIDAMVADAIIQCALFDDVIYG